MTFQDSHYSYYLLTVLPMAYFFAVWVISLIINFVFEDGKAHKFCEKMFFCTESDPWDLHFFYGFFMIGCGGGFILLLLITLTYIVGLSGLIALGVGIAALFIARSVVRLDRRLKAHTGDKKAHQ